MQYSSHRLRARPAAVRPRTEPSVRSQATAAPDRSIPAAAQDDDAVTAQPGGVGERGSLRHPAPGGDRLEVAEMRPLAPDGRTLLDQLVDAQPLEPVALAGPLDD